MSQPNILQILIKRQHFPVQARPQIRISREIIFLPMSLQKYAFVARQRCQSRRAEAESRIVDLESVGAENAQQVLIQSPIRQTKTRQFRLEEPESLGESLEQLGAVIWALIGRKGGYFGRLRECLGRASGRAAYCCGCCCCSWSASAASSFWRFGAFFCLRELVGELLMSLRYKHSKWSLYLSSRPRLLDSWMLWASVVSKAVKLAIWSSALAMNSEPIRIKYHK